MDKQQLRELLEKATPGPWNVAADHEGILSEFKASPRRPITRLMDTRFDSMTQEERFANAELICYLRNHASELLEAAERADALYIEKEVARRTCNENYDWAKREQKAKEAAEAQRDRMEKALREYGYHSDDCPKFYDVSTAKPCKCGFAEALKEAENGE